MMGPIHASCRQRRRVSAGQPALPEQGDASAIMNNGLVLRFPSSRRNRAGGSARRRRRLVRRTGTAQARGRPGGAVSLPDRDDRERRGPLEGGSGRHVRHHRASDGPALRIASSLIFGIGDSRRSGGAPKNPSARASRRGRLGAPKGRKFEPPLWRDGCMGAPLGRDGHPASLEGNPRVNGSRGAEGIHGGAALMSAFVVLLMGCPERLSLEVEAPSLADLARELSCNRFLLGRMVAVDGCSSDNGVAIPVSRIAMITEPD